MKYATKISQFFSNQNALFIIPLYQRRYAWDKENCRRLFDDIVKINKNHLPSHFFGSIVTVQESMVEEDLLIIDGQQRITTISIIVLAIKNAVLNKKIICERPDMLEKKSDIYLNASFRETLKLRSIEQDRLAYEKLFSNDETELINDSGITSNYLYFYDRVINSGMTAEELLGAVERLVIIDLRLEQDDDPQLIFESLNSTGKDLTEADKVRNYMLMGLKKQQQEDFYYRYWSKIEKLTNGDPTMFFRDFLTMKLRKIGTPDNLYFDFKQYDLDGHFDRKELLSELLRYANIYHIITTGDNADKRLSKKKQLASIGSTVGNPYYMILFAYAEDGHIDDNELYSVLDITENYWARRIICGYPANSLAKIFATLHGDILRIYTQFAKALPKDCVILTAGCAKYKYNKLDLGDIGGIPRVLDAGQCNDSYSLALIALKLKGVFGLDDVNQLPIAYIIAWYEQKAVIVLLALLSLGVKNIHLGPTLPAFLSPNVANVLVSNFGIGGINTVKDDLKLLIGK